MSKGNQAKLYGALFIFSYLIYSVGLGLMVDVMNVNAQPINIYSNKSQIVIGGLMISVFHTIANIGLLVIMFSILKSFNYVLASIYLVAGVCATLMLALGGLLLMIPIPIGEELLQPNIAYAGLFKNTLLFCTRGNFYFYQIGMAIWGVGGIVLSVLLFTYKLVPKMLCLFGALSYMVFITGVFLELFGYTLGTMLSVPGALFEIGLSILLMVKGFNDICIETK